MRLKSIQHRLGAAARRRLARPRTLGAALVGTAGVIAISCSKDVSPTVSRIDATSRRQDMPAPATAPAPVPFAAPPNEAAQAQGIMADRSAVELSKVAGDEKLGVPAQSPAVAIRRGGVPGMPSASAVSQPSTVGSMIIRTGYAGIEVDSLDSAIARVRALAQRVNGFVANTAVQGGKDQLRSASIEVKVPAERFDDALAGLSPIGKVESVNVNAEDVGEEYVDIAARVENAHRLETRLVDLLANRTGKLQDVLSVERELARVREEIERYEGRMRFLRSRVAMSTLTIAVHEHVPVIVPVAGDGPILVAFRQAWRNFVGLIAGLIASLGILIPLGVVGFVAWIGVRRYLPVRGASPAPAANAGAAGGD